MISTKKIMIKYLAGKITDKKLLAFRSLMADPVHREEFEKYVGDHYYVNKELTSLDLDKEYTAILKRIGAKRKKRRLLLYRVAAILIVVLGVGLYLQLSLTRPDVVPDGVTIKLYDGTIEQVSEQGAVDILDKEGNVVARQEGDVINYHSGVAPVENTSRKKLVYNELSVPFGKRFRLLLADGTKVSLNSGSKIRFPVSFSENAPREVFLDGEAFFDVTEDKQRPFRVNSKEFHIQVIGTKFNVNSYAEDKSISTVLVDGVVGLYHDSSKELSKDKMVTLVPGELAVYNKNKMDIKVKEVDTEEYISWIDGVLLFKVRPFSEIIRVLERHYDVQITNNYKAIENKRFFAKFNVESIEEVLQSFQRSKPFSYQIKGNNIIIDKP